MAQQNQYELLLRAAAMARQGLKVPESPKYQKRAPLPVPQQNAVPDGAALEAAFYKSPQGKQQSAAASKQAPRRGFLNRVLDALSIGTYTAASIGDELVGNIAAQKKDMSNSNLSTMDKIRRTAGRVVDTADPFKNIAEGAIAANPFGDSENDKERRTFSHVLENIQERTGTRNEESKGQRVGNALAGFAGDVFLDPLTYVGIGAIPKFSRGAKVAKEALSEGKVGGEAIKINPLPDTPMPKVSDYDVANPVTRTPKEAIVERKSVGDDFPVGTVTDPETVMGRVVLKQLEGATPPPAPTVNVVPGSGKVYEAGNTVRASDDIAGALPTGQDVIRTPDELYRKKGANPIHGMGYKEFTEALLANKIDPKDLTPFMRHFGVSDVGMLQKAIKGKFGKTNATLREAHWTKIRDELAPPVVTNSSAAADALELGKQGLFAAARARVLHTFKKERVTRFTDPDPSGEVLETAFNMASKKALDKTVKNPHNFGKVPSAKQENLHYFSKEGAGKVTALGSNNLMDQATSSGILRSELTRAMTKNYPNMNKIDRRNLITSAIKRYEDNMREIGMPPHLGLGAHNTGLPLGLSDVFAIMRPEIVDKYLLSYANAIQTKTALAGIEAALTHPTASRATLRTAIEKAMHEMDLGMSNALKPNIKLKGKQVKNEDFNPVAFTEFADDILDSMPEFMQALRINSDSSAVLFGEKVAALAEQQVSNLVNTLNKADWDGGIEAVLGLERNIAADAKAGGIMSNIQSYVKAAMDEIMEEIPELADPVIRQAVKDQGKVADAVSNAYKHMDDIPGSPVANPQVLGPADVKKVREASTKNSEETQRIADELNDLSASTEKLINDINPPKPKPKKGKAEEPDPVNVQAESSARTRAAAQMGDQFMESSARHAKGIIDTFGRMFNGSHKMGKAASSFHNDLTSLRGFTAQFADNLVTLSAKYSKADMKQMFDMYRTGQMTDEMMKSDELFHGMMNMTFSGHATGSKVSRMSRAGILDTDMIYHYQKAGVADDFMVLPSDPKALENMVFPDNFDVADYFNRTFMAQMEAIQMSSQGKSFSGAFGKTGKRPGPDWYHPEFNVGSRDAHQLAAYIDPTRWYHKSTLEGLSEMNRHLRDLDKMFDYGLDGVNSFMSNVVKPVTSKWKLWQTVIRPGHHVKNQIGDMMLTYLAGHNGIGMYNDALRILRAHHKEYKGIDGLERRIADSIDGVPTSASMGGPDKAYGHLRITDEEIFRQAKSENIMVDFYIAEDLQLGSKMGEAVSGLRASNNPVGRGAGKLEGLGGTISEYRDNHVRLAHFVAAVKKTAKKNPKMNKDQIYKLAGEEVRKWHPNGTGMSVWENKYAKLGMMFYSWNRMTLPLMIESFLTKPGRTMVAPKAMYAIANAGGIDLDHGFGNPFPVDQIYPDYMTDDLYGPIARGEDGSELGVMPGIPQMDFLNEMGTPGRFTDTVLRSANPLARVPAEIAMGRKWGTQEKEARDIYDMSEYIDAQIPLASYANNMTGRSLSSGFTQETKKAERGQRGDSPVRDSIINLLLGMGAKDYTSEQFQDRAWKDEKARNKDEIERMGR